MIKGFYTAASAMIARLDQQKLLSHNISNLNTPGFKQTLTALEEYLQVDVYPFHSAQSPSDQLKKLGRMGLGVNTTPEITDFSQGSLRATGQPLDVALEGAGFFRVRTPEGERYTRDGRFAVDADSQLVTVDGYAVLDESGGTIELPQGTVRISSQGEIFVNGTQEGRLGLAVFENPQENLAREKDNLYQAAGQPTGDVPGTLLQGYLEMSNIDPAVMMTEMAKVARTYEAAQKMMQSQDQLLGRAINTLGRY